MAKAITQVQKVELTEEEKRKQDLMEIEDALLEHKDSILEALNMLGHLQNRGILTMASSLFAEGDKVLDIIIKAIDNPEATNMLKNMLLMVGVLGTLNVKQLEPFILKVNSGIARVAEGENDPDDDGKIGYFEFARSLKDPEVNRSVNLLLTFLKGMGQDTSHLERTTQPPSEQAYQQVPREKHGMHKRE